MAIISIIRLSNILSDLIISSVESILSISFCVVFVFIREESVIISVFIIGVMVNLAVVETAFFGL